MTRARVGVPPVPAGPRPIVVGVDAAPESFAAVAFAAELARDHEVPLRLVHALAEQLETAPGGLQRLEAVARAAAGQPATAITAVVRRGPADLVLAHESHGASLLVVHSAGGASGSGGGLGPVAAALVRRSACPVLVHRSVRNRSGIVTGATGGPGTAALLAAAVGAAARRRSPLLVVLHAWSGGRGPVDDEAVDRAEAALCEGYLTPLRAARPDVRIDVQVDHGEPADCLVRAAGTAELVVVGRAATGRRGTAADVAARAAAPVLVVPLPPTA